MNSPVGFPRWCSGKEFACQCRNCKRCRFDSWARKSSWSRKWQPTPLFLPGKFHGQRSLVGYGPRGCKDSDMTERLSTQTNWSIYSNLYEETVNFTVRHSVSQSVQLLSRVRLFATPWIAARQPSLSITNFRSSPKPMSIESVMPSSHLILCYPLLFLPSIFPSIRVFSSESVLRIRWPKDLSFSFSISPFKEYSGLISFKIDWLDLLAVQGTRKSLLQHHSSKASILQHSAFFTVQLSYPYMTTGKTIALTRWTLSAK